MKRQENQVQKCLDGMLGSEIRFKIKYRIEPDDIDVDVCYAVTFIQPR